MNYKITMKSAFLMRCKILVAKNSRIGTSDICDGTMGHFSYVTSELSSAL